MWRLLPCRIFHPLHLDLWTTSHIGATLHNLAIKRAAEDDKNGVVPGTCKVRWEPSPKIDRTAHHQ
jgi:hypothetical protein